MKLQKGGEQRMEQAQVQGQQQVQKEFTDDCDVVWWKEETEGCEEPIE